MASNVSNIKSLVLWAGILYCKRETGQPEL